MNPVNCRCTIIPGYMTEKITEEYRNIDERTAFRMTSVQNHNQIRGLRSLYFEGDAEAPKKEGKPYKLIKVFDAGNGWTFDGPEVKSPKNSDDREIANAFKWTKKTYQFYHDIFGRHSIDNNNMEIVSHVHYGQNYTNTFWDGKRVVYGDADGVYFNSFTDDIDVTTHEIAHGVTQCDMNLRYRHQAGALNESLADVFASMAKQYVRQTKVPDADWKIGENLLIGSGNQNYALRSLKEPGTAYVNHPVFGTDPQPASLDAYVITYDDYNGVHINSGIPNKAFYLACEKMYQIDHEKYAFSWKGAGQVWSGARLRDLRTNASFVDFARATIQEANELYGKRSKESKAILYAWAEVKVLYGKSSRNSRCRLY